MKPLIGFGFAPTALLTTLAKTKAAAEAAACVPPRVYISETGECVPICTSLLWPHKRQHPRPASDLVAFSVRTLAARREWRSRSKPVSACLPVHLVRGWTWMLALVWP